MKRTTLTIAISTAMISTPLTVLADNHSPYLAQDGSWISLSGTVTSTTADSFELDYGRGIVTVEMDDWDWFDDNNNTIPGDKVTVYGEVDDDTYELTSIEASSVYVENLGTTFYASPADEEDIRDFDLVPTVPIAVGDVTLTGTVQSVTGREFTIDTDIQQVTVDTTLMSYNPTDDEGYQQIDVGDTVTVLGDMDYDTFENRELMADNIVTLDDDTNS